MIQYGGWKADVRHGEGIYSWADGEQFSGVWCEGKIKSN